MNKDLKIGIYQYDIYWQDVKSNQEKIEKFLAKLPHLPDVLILPEMYSTGFTMAPDTLESKLLNNQQLWQSRLSREFNVAIMGSVVVIEDQHFKNRFLYTTNTGEFFIYDKRHLFLNEYESGFYRPGKERKFFSLNEIKVMPQICYDLRFPVWSRNDVAYEVLIYVANWPSGRQFVWESLLKARAIENQCYVIGVNRVGVDGNKIKYIGGSVVYSPKGEVLSLLSEKEEYAEVILSMQSLYTFKEKFPVYKDADSFTIND